VHVIITGGTDVAHEGPGRERTKSCLVVQGHLACGGTESFDFPTPGSPFSGRYNGLKDAFVATLTREGGLTYATYLGGRQPDCGEGVTVDDAGNAYVTGWTESDDFPLWLNPIREVFEGSTEAFVTKLDPDIPLLLVYSTFLGGRRPDKGHGIAMGPSGNAYVTGMTDSTDFHRVAIAGQQTDDPNCDPNTCAPSVPPGFFDANYHDWEDAFIVIINDDDIESTLTECGSGLGCGALGPAGFAGMMVGYGCLMFTRRRR